MLLNIVIAMMNHTYDSAIALQETLWCIESLHFVFVGCSASELYVCRYISCKFIFDGADESQLPHMIHQEGHERFDTSDELISTSEESRTAKYEEVKAKKTNT